MPVKRTDKVDEPSFYLHQHLNLRHIVVKNGMLAALLSQREFLEIEGREIFANACKVGVEGVVSKVRD
jgi:hypothetical protein